jgi:hypothetical protein
MTTDETEEEDWWEVSPQTEQEMKVFKRQKEATAAVAKEPKEDE